MNRTTKSIIGLGVAVIVLGGGLTALMLTEPKENENSESNISASEESSETYGEGILLLKDEKAGDSEGLIKSLIVKNDGNRIWTGCPAPWPCS